jgi:hypothetical protein
MAFIPIPSLPILRHKSPFFRDGFLSMAVIGKSGCGKTQLLANILPGISDQISTVIIASVIRGVPLHIAIINYFKSLGKFAGVSNDPEEMRGFVDMAERTGEVSLNDQGLIIFDDFNDGRATGPFWNFIIHAFTKLRNSGWNFIIISQQPSFIPPIVRNCTTARVLFDCYSKSAFDTFTRDVRDRVPDREAYNSILGYIQAIPFSYMMVQEHPFTVTIGKGSEAKKIMDAHIVDIPTLKEIRQQMGAKDNDDLDKKTKEAQINAGNTNFRLYD